MGLTGAGKSTLICKLAGIPIEHKRVHGKFEFSHNLSEYPKIGNTA